MTIITIKYEKLMPTGAYMNEKIGFECSIEERENPMEVITKLRELAEQAHKEKYPHLYHEEINNKKPMIVEHDIHVNSFGNSKVFIPIEKKDPKQLQIQLHIDSINSYTDKERLIKIYAPLVEKTPELKEAYNTRLNELKEIQ